MLKFNKSNFLCVFLSIFYFFSNYILADTPLNSSMKPEKYNLSICAIFKNEASYLKEWIEYYRLVGVDHFYLYNNNSTDQYMQVLQPYIQDEIVTLIHWPDIRPEQSGNTECYWVLKTQIPAYENACKIKAFSETTWLAFIDIDEFIVPVEALKITDVLDKYNNFPGVTLYWQIYGTSDVRELPPNTLLIETLNKTALPSHNLNHILKTIVKPECFIGFAYGPHKCIFKNNASAKEVNKSEMRINHYINRTLDYLLEHKLAKKQHMDNRSPEFKYYLELGNDIEDTEKFIFRFVPQLRKQMKFDS